jgi:hypothetical protein
MPIRANSERSYEKQSQGTSIFITIMGLVIVSFLSIGAMIGALIRCRSIRPPGSSSALVSGAMMAIIGGFFPALRAARISPIEAMRG